MWKRQILQAWERLLAPKNGCLPQIRAYRIEAGGSPQKAKRKKAARKQKSKKGKKPTKGLLGELAETHEIRQNGVQRIAAAASEAFKAAKSAERDYYSSEQILNEPQLCPEQIELIDLILSGRNVFFTGSAGSGKSTVLKFALQKLKDRNKIVYPVAPTGRAALNINGQTSWSYAGLTPDSRKLPLNKLITEVNRSAKRRIEHTDVLVIDEISMMENHHLQRLNYVMKDIRQDSRPFGGVQVIICGDFHQLAPVKPFQFCIECGKSLTQSSGTGEYYICQTDGKWADADKWAFRSEVWQECQFQYVYLRNIHRQRDAAFIELLEKCRRGEAFSDTETGLLLNHDCNVEGAVRLYPTRREVDKVNEEKFAELPDIKKVFTCVDDYILKPDHAHLQYLTKRDVNGSLKYFKDHQLDSYIELKTGMLVILLVNLSVEEGLINGSQGKIIGWQKNDERSYSSMVRIKEEYREVFDNNVYNFILRASDNVWPIVRFTNGHIRVIPAFCRIHAVGETKPYSLVMRTQIPLRAAWALSIHKSQGMTLDRAIIDLSQTFEDQQIYVALSRVRSLYDLKIEGLKQRRGDRSEAVEMFMREKLGHKESILKNK